jgi:hypothetical protein
MSPIVKKKKAENKKVLVRKQGDLHFVFIIMILRKVNFESGGNNNRHTRKKSSTQQEHEGNKRTQGTGYFI